MPRRGDPGEALAAERRGAPGARRRRLSTSTACSRPTTSSPARTSSSPRPASPTARSSTASATRAAARRRSRSSCARARARSAASRRPHALEQARAHLRPAVPLAAARRVTAATRCLHLGRVACPRVASAVHASRGAGSAAWPAATFASSPLPRLQRGRLERAAVGERQLPRVRPHRVHRVQVRGRVLVGLAAGEEDDPRNRRRHVTPEAADRRLGDLLDAGAARRLVARRAPCSA